MRSNFRDLVRWSDLPAIDDVDSVWRFSQTFNAYLTHGPDPETLTEALRHVVPADFDEGPINTKASTEDLRAALFMLARAARLGDDTLDPLPKTWTTILKSLMRRADGPYLCVERPGQTFGYAPTEFELAEGILRSPLDLALLATLHLPAAIDSDHLAWLALTSKPELAVRDAFGDLLHRSLGTDAHVTREWRHTDLAVLSTDGRPLILVEGKALYGFDVLNPRTLAKYVGLVRKDLAKAAAVAVGQPDVAILATVLVASPLTPWAESAAPAIAYQSQNAAFVAAGAERHQEVRALMWSALRPLGAVGVVDLGTGTAFDSSVNVTMFVVRPTAQDGRTRRLTLHERWALDSNGPFHVVPARLQPVNETNVGDTP
ncbi:hypothetical protein L615_000400000440 [Nocardioides sp. J9]|uniref:hypothetical protein n=1 Tax=Nocardioides sp. J9 TaxID=935844 RepID=UPI0011A2B56B|nr:hypothetical protein [Nocardioides sp. J9]TWG96942.1 hypothetical protein L615_000400000440 [Nocardioides sp. J9]